ncbi:hypothetical protein HQO84_21625 [Rhodococcus fascians]|nr:hypothetical protein [Rhodococcus fascians]MBY3998226.1 hypothetical protein [Rhodococcus fascians]MBY4004388.1 hypothetical protein [Rhodococcus fascians]MBY4009039.1 hypothetical protein [Rhodococcus fascians]MBY4019595.1 hypothetical protein [Rhodococcus fascians]
MDWVEKELRVAAATGACTGVGVMLPWALEGTLSRLALLVFPAFCGAVAGLLVGVIAVGGGRYTLWSNRLWPARSHRIWRHRFATCTTAAVTLVGALAMFWLFVAAGEISTDTDEFPPWWIALAAITASSYLFAFLLAPPTDRTARTVDRLGKV